MKIVTIKEFTEKYPKVGTRLGKNGYVKFVAYEVAGKIVGYPQKEGLAELYEMNRKF